MTHAQREQQSRRKGVPRRGTRLQHAAAVVLTGAVLQVWAPGASAQAPTPDAVQQARALRHAGQAPQAQALLQQLLQREPNNQDARLELVWALIQQNQLQQAQRELDGVLAAQPELADAQLAQALLWRRTGETARAEAAYRALLARDPANTGAADGLAALLLQGGHTAEAGQLYTGVLASHPQDDEALMGMGRVSARQGDWRQAQAYFERAQAAQPGSPEPAQALQALLPAQRWQIGAWTSWSALSGGRSDWHEYLLDLSYRLDPATTVGASVTRRDRFGQSDVLLDARVSHYQSATLEWHADALSTPGADFSPDKALGAGVDWRASQRVSLLFDYRYLHYPAGGINVYIPGITWWFDARNSLTWRYAYGRAFGDASFNNYGLQLNLGLPRDAMLHLGASRGTDPERAPGLPGTLLTTANVLSAYVDWPVGSLTRLYAGVEHEVRLGLYRRDTLSIGISRRF